ncbi:hypothetical protein [Ligilactobacillus faecis]|uniref:hypothetical protein n=1 Tax=Ligilactobacillus faecis TaxID=762833 RepID=UPI002469BEC7|nr:hypothetical protein [Ligilactobacillus faecis]WGN90316.1 hypothetical protein QFX10_04430 [Ligilactobacillus faecis]
MMKIFKRLIVVAMLNMLLFSTFSSMSATTVSMLTGQMGINATVATQITSMLNAGATVWGIIAILGSLNVVGAGVLFTAKAMLKKLGTKAVVSW